MTPWLSALGIGAGCLLLTGCATPASDTMPSAEPLTPSPSASHSQGWAFCDAFSEHLTDYATFILDASNGSVDSGAFITIDKYATKLRDLVTTAAAGDVEDYLGPFDAINEVVLAGGGPLAFNTDAYKASNLTLLNYCVDDVGYKKPKVE